MLIRIIPIGDVPEKLLEEVIAGLQEVLNARCKVFSKIPMPKQAFNQWRKQYSVEKLIELACEDTAAKFIEKTIPLLFITDHDIYFAGMNFVFGLTTERCCIISIARLRQEFYDLSPNNFLLTQRSIKEAVHELGHYLGLEHCIHPWCVMSFSQSVKDVDTKQKDFCNDCKIKMSIRGIKLE